MSTTNLSKHADSVITKRLSVSSATLLHSPDRGKDNDHNAIRDRKILLEISNFSLCVKVRSAPMYVPLNVRLPLGVSLA